MKLWYKLRSVPKKIQIKKERKKKKRKKKKLNHYIV